MNFNVESAVFSEGLTITALPVASAAAADQHNRQKGKVNGWIMTTTPIGSLKVK